MIRINLLPVRAEKKKESLRQQAILAGGALVLVAAILAGVHFTLGSAIADLQGNIETRRNEITRLQVAIGEVKEYKKKKRELEEKIAVITGLEERQRGPARVLYEIAQLLPEKVWIESWKDSAGSLSLNGVAIDNQTIAQLMTKMQASPWFQGVRLEVTQQVNRGGASLKSFSIRATIVYGKGA